MKKKLLALLVAIASAFSLAFAFGGCGDGGSESGSGSSDSTQQGGSGSGNTNSDGGSGNTGSGSGNTGSGSGSGSGNTGSGTGSGNTGSGSGSGSGSGNTGSGNEGSSSGNTGSGSGSGTGSGTGSNTPATPPEYEQTTADEFKAALDGIKTADNVKYIQKHEESSGWTEERKVLVDMANHITYKSHVKKDFRGDVGASNEEYYVYKDRTVIHYTQNYSLNWSATSEEIPESNIKSEVWSGVGDDLFTTRYYGSSTLGNIFQRFTFDSKTGLYKAKVYKGSGTDWEYTITFGMKDKKISMVKMEYYAARMDQTDTYTITYGDASVTLPSNVASVVPKN